MSAEPTVPSESRVLRGGIGAVLGLLVGAGVMWWVDGASPWLLLVTTAVGFLLGVIGGNRLLREVLSWL